MNERRKSNPSALEVRLDGRRVGVISRFAGDRSIFAFEEDYIEDPERPTLSLSFKTASGGLVTDIRPVSVRVPPFFSNLLPEGHLRDYLAVRAGVKPDREFFLLHALGADLPGAVTTLPIDADAGDDEQHGHGDGEHRESPALRFSLAGVQLKFSAVLEATGGLTVPANGIGGSWIVKLPSMRFPAVAENEFVAMELAGRVGIPVPRLKLLPVQEIAGLPAEITDLKGKALAVERFDRLPDGRRVHIEDFAQVFGLFPGRKYERRSYANIAAVLWVEAGEVAVNDFMRRLVFSVLIGNADMHLKNWSLIYPDGRTPALSPAYDLLATLPYLPSDRLALGFGGGKDISGISQEQIRRLADTAGLAVSPLWRIVEETIERTIEAWRGHDAKEVLPIDIRTAIDGQIRKVASRTLSGPT
ncbi:MAG: HipA domain-containing protein [Alphaproteobacteria bacterium]|nr:HipA domain-containing protein [Alphaproteobacteria bacterium]MDP6565076.1 HipA domain-containing protein [Alphaproteobacteria bacterium]